MSQMVYAIAQRAASEAVSPVVQWINGPQADAIEAIAQRAARNAARTGAQSFQPLPGHPLPAAPAQGAILHPLAPKLLALLSQGEQVMLVGGAGSGKTTASQWAAAALGRHFGAMSLAGGVSESSFSGWLLPIGEGGRFEYVPSEFVNNYSGAHGPALQLLDEYDRADAGVAVLANSALANGFFAVPQRYQAPMIPRADCLIVAGANTFGDGAGDAQYAAAQALDAATLDRFYGMRWEGDDALERAILLGDAPPALWAPAHDWSTMTQRARDAADRKAVEWVQNVRTAAREASVGRIVSIRMAQRFLRALRAGIGAREAQRDLLAAWSDDECARLKALNPRRAA
jgi:MoxR-like ATPase